MVLLWCTVLDVNLNTTFYHGTYLKDALQIQKGGFKIGRARSRGAVLGPGVYISANRNWALNYANDVRNDTGEDAALLHLKIHPAKPLDMNPANWPEDFKAIYEKDTGRPASNAMKDQLFPTIGRHAHRMGFDAIVFDKGTTVVFDPTKVKVVKVEELPASRTASYDYDRR